MKELLKEEFPNFLQGFEEERYGGVRYNSLKVQKEEWEQIAPFSIQSVPWTSNGYYYQLNEQPAKHPFYFAGLYYIQEPSAMTPAQMLGGGISASRVYRETITSEELLEIAVSKALELGADGISNFEAKVIYNTTYTKYGTTQTLSHYEIKGLCIDRQ